MKWAEEIVKIETRKVLILTEDEKQIIKALMEGKNSMQIGKEIFKANKTVLHSIARMAKVLKVKGRKEIIKYFQNDNTN